MNKILTDNLPVIPIYYDQAICFLKNDVKNLKLSPINTIDFKYVDKKWFYFFLNLEYLFLNLSILPAVSTNFDFPV